MLFTRFLGIFTTTIKKLNFIVKFIILHFNYRLNPSLNYIYGICKYLIFISLQKWRCNIPNNATENPKLIGELTQ